MSWTYVPADDAEGHIAQWERQYTPRLRGIVWPPNAAVAYPRGMVEILRGDVWQCLERRFAAAIGNSVMQDIDNYVADLREAVGE